MKSVLIVCFDFPPIANVGGRRWAKFAKYLTRRGYRVHVISATFYGTTISPWQSDIEDNSNIVVHRLPLRYPPVLFSTWLGGWGAKLRYRAADLFCKLLSRGTPYDKALFWKRQYLRRLDRVVRENNIQHIIATGAPFRLLYYTALYKQQHPGIHFIADMRDPWTWGELFGYGALSKKRKDWEQRMLLLTMQSASYVTVPVEDMQQQLMLLFPGMQAKIKFLSHGYDEDETGSLPAPQKTDRGILRLVLFGTLYDGIGPYLEQIADCLAKFGGRVQLDIYTQTSNYRYIFDHPRLHDIVHYHDMVPAHELFQKVRDYHYVVIINPERVKNYISTKFYEVIACKVPMIYIAEEGKVAEFIRNNNIGLHYNLQTLPNIEEILTISRDRFSYEYDVSSFSFNKLTDHLINFLH